MTSKTPFLNLQLYSTVSDGSSLFYSFVDDLSGTSASSNMKLIDSNASQVSASIIRLSASVTVLQSTPSTIAGSSIMSDSTGSVVKHNVSGVTAGSYTTVLVDKYGHITSGSQGATSSIQIVGRVGGDPTSWNTQGITAYTPTSAKMQVGVFRVTWPGGTSSTSASVSFPVSYASNPIVYITRQTIGNSGAMPSGDITSLNTTGFVCLVYSGVAVGMAPAAGTTSDFSWLSVGS